MMDHLNVGLADSNTQNAWPLSEHLSEDTEGAFPTENTVSANLLDSCAMKPSIDQASVGTVTPRITGRESDSFTQTSLLDPNYLESYETEPSASESMLTPLCDDKELSSMRAFLKSFCHLETEAMTEAESNRDGSSSERLESTSRIVDYDTCFGVVSYAIALVSTRDRANYRPLLKIYTNALSSFNGGQRSDLVPVTMQRFGDMIKLYFQDSHKYAGLIVTPILGKILDDFSVKCVASVVASSSQPCQARYQKNGKDLTRQKECSVRIVMYGLKHEESIIGDLLSDSSLFLQQPSAAECDRNIIYSNPHYLVRPGSKMPTLDGLAMSSDTSAGAASEKLNEVTQSRFMRLFDTANVKIQLHVTPSSRLRTSLKE